MHKSETDRQNWFWIVPSVCLSVCGEDVSRLVGQAFFVVVGTGVVALAGTIVRRSMCARAPLSLSVTSKPKPKPLRGLLRQNNE